jgi:hypothetical protein
MIFGGDKLMLMTTCNAHAHVHALATFEVNTVLYMHLAICEINIAKSDPQTKYMFELAVTGEACTCNVHAHVLVRYEINIAVHAMHMYMYLQQMK